MVHFHKRNSSKGSSVVNQFFLYNAKQQKVIMCSCFVLVIKENVFISNKMLLRVLFNLKRFTKKIKGYFLLNRGTVRFFTSKGNNIRIGKGKGSIKGSFYFLKKGSILFFLVGFSLKHSYFLFSVVKGFFGFNFIFYCVRKRVFNTLSFF